MRVSTRPVSMPPAPISCRIGAGRLVGCRGGAAGHAHRHQAGQHAAGADQQQDHHRPGRSGAAVVRLGTAASSSSASAPSAPTGRRITPGPAGRPPRWCNWARAPAPSRPARRRRRRRATGSSPTRLFGRRGGGDRGARRNQRGQHVIGADQQLDRRRYGRPAAAVEFVASASQPLPDQ